MFKANPKLKKVFLLGFLMALHLAFTSYINSSFLASFSGEKNVSLIYILGSLSSILVLFYIPKVLQKLGGYRFLLCSAGLNAISLFVLLISKNTLAIFPIFIFYFTLNNLIIFALDELLQMFSENSKMGRVRGLYLTFLNLAWVISQALAGRILANSSFSSLYLIGFIIMSIFFVTAFVSLKNIKDPKYDKVLAWQSFKNFFANKNLARAYKINFLLQFFYVWMVIYTPIYLSAHLGFDWKQIGMIFTVMLLPFVLIQFPLGTFSDKIGEKKMLLLGFIIASLATLALFFIKAHEVWIWALALFATRVGAAIIEVMSDVYFFKHITRENDEFISIYRNAGPVSYIVAPFLAFILFSFTQSFNFIFIILGMFMLGGLYIASTIKKTDS